MKGNVKKRIENKLYRIIRKVLPDGCFRKAEAYFIKYNSKYNENRYKYAYILSARRDRNKYCILRYEVGLFGLFAVARAALLGCEWAEKNKMIPIVDWEWHCYYENNMLGERNLWEDIFETKLPVKLALENKNVFVGKLNWIYSDSSMRKELSIPGDGCMLIFPKGNDRAYYKKMKYYSDKWWKLKTDVQERFDVTFSQLFDSKMKILGVALREEFAMEKKDIEGTVLENYPHHLEVDEMINIIKKYKELWGCTHVFVTTYMKDSIDKMRKEFGDSLLFTTRRRVPFEKYKAARKMLEENMQEKNLYIEHDLAKELYAFINKRDEWTDVLNMYDRNTMIEYTEEIYGLSLCDCLLAGKSGGGLAACIWNGGKYEEIKILSDESVLY